MSLATASASSERADTRIPEDQIIVLFGATGDLARRKLLPGIFHLVRVGLMPRRFRIIGVARHGLDPGEFRELAREAVDGSGRRSLDAEAWERFAESLRFVGVGDGFGELADAIADAREELGMDAGVLLYLSLPPRAMRPTIEDLGEI